MNDVTGRRTLDEEYFAPKQSQGEISSFTSSILTNDSIFKSPTSNCTPLFISLAEKSALREPYYAAREVTTSLLCIPLENAILWLKKQRVTHSFHH